MKDKTRIVAQADPLGMSTKIYVIPSDHPASHAIEPEHSLSRENAIELMDSLWGAGIRPTDLPEKVRHLVGSNDQHLQDMRKIAGKYLKIEL